MKEPSTIRRLAENIPFLSRHDETAEDELPLDSLERTEFLPTPQPAQSRGGRLATRSSWPPKDIAQVSSRKIIPLIASGSIVIILFMFWLRGSEPHLPLDVPPQSSELARKLASELIDTKIHPYILHYAPLVFLDTREKFYPSDLREHLRHTHPALNYTPITGFSSRIGLSNLASLNASGGEDIFLTLNEDSQVTSSSKFLEGHKPDKKTLQTFGRSCAVITHDWGDGTIDAYYMYFYTFNQGPTVLGKEIGDHVGDWEHNMIRFHDMIPQAIWYSQHSYGEAYTYDAVEKIGKRPVVYSAKGSHANYPTAGKHDLSVIEPRIPAGIAFDYTSTGALWDPTLSAFFHKFWPETRTFSTIRIGDPDSYLFFNGKWGDKQYPDDDPIQMVYEGEYHKFTSGPNGPLFKHLDRTDVCLDDSRPCVISEKL